MIKLGIWGCGAMGSYHAKRFSSFPGVKLTTCFDRDSTRAVNLATTYHIPHIAEDFDSFAYHCNAACCALVDSEHWSAALQVARAGLPLFLEKPMARTGQESWDIHEAFRKSGQPLVVNFSKRNSPALQGLRDLVREGRLGVLQSLECEYLQDWLDEAGDWQRESKWLWRTTEHMSCYGVLGDLVSHLFDIACFLIDSDEQMNLSTAAGIRTPVRAEAGGAWQSVRIQGSCGGVQLNWHASRSAPGHADTLTATLKGTLGEAFVDLESHRNEVLWRSGEGETWRPVTARPTTYDHFVLLCQNAVPTEVVPGTLEGHRVQCLLDEAHVLLLKHEAGQ